MIHIHLRSTILGSLLVAALGALPAQRAAAQAAQTVQNPPATAQSASDGSMQISWEVRNRFRLFREERDFLLHSDSARGQTILGAEQALEVQSDGRGWARNAVNRLCIDLAGRVSEPCTRDNVKESYLTPSEHPVTVRLTRGRDIAAACGQLAAAAA